MSDRRWEVRRQDWRQHTPLGTQPPVVVLASGLSREEAMAAVRRYKADPVVSGPDVLIGAACLPPPKKPR